jgi:hypothetical protein
MSSSIAILAPATPSSSTAAYGQSSKAPASSSSSSYSGSLRTSTPPSAQQTRMIHERRPSLLSTSPSGALQAVFGKSLLSEGLRLLICLGAELTNPLRRFGHRKTRVQRYQHWRTRRTASTGDLPCTIPSIRQTFAKHFSPDFVPFLESRICMEPRLVQSGKLPTDEATLTCQRRDLPPLVHRLRLRPSREPTRARTRDHAQRRGDQKHVPPINEAQRTNTTMTLCDNHTRRSPCVLRPIDSRDQWDTHRFYTYKISIDHQTGVWTESIATPAFL